MKKVLFATTNPGKVRRFYNALKEADIELLSLKDLNINVDIEENGESALENSSIKARAYSKLVDMCVFSMDDSLYIDNLSDELQPKTHVKRVNGKTLNDEEMIEYYSSLAKRYGVEGKLTCRWVYGITLIKDGREYTFTWKK